MNEPLGYSCDGDVVTLRMTTADHANLVMALGLAAGTIAREGERISSWLAFANRIEAGNPDWTPYDV